MITPAGKPSWLRTNDLTHYGGDINKQNYLSRGAIDALTDVDAAQFSRMASDTAALQRVMPFCSMTLLCHDSVAPTDPTVEFINMQIGNTGTYLGNAPPSGFPTVTRNGTGDVSITFSATYSDPYNISAPYSVGAIIPALLSVTAGKVEAEKVSSSVVRLRAFDNVGTALGDVRISVVIW